MKMIVVTNNWRNYYNSPLLTLYHADPTMMKLVMMTTAASIMHSDAVKNVVTECPFGLSQKPIRPTPNRDIEMAKVQMKITAILTRLVVTRVE